MLLMVRKYHQISVNATQRVRRYRETRLTAGTLLALAVLRPLRQLLPEFQISEQLPLVLLERLARHSGGLPSHVVFEEDPVLDARPEHPVTEGQQGGSVRDLTENQVRVDQVPGDEIAASIHCGVADLHHLVRERDVLADGDVDVRVRNSGHRWSPWGCYRATLHDSEFDPQLADHSVQFGSVNKLVLAFE